MYFDSDSGSTDYHCQNTHTDTSSTVKRSGLKVQLILSFWQPKSKCWFPQFSANHKISSSFTVFDSAKILLFDEPG